MRMFLACPRQYQFRLENTPQTGLPEIMVRGKFAHSFYERYTKQCMSDNSMQRLDAIDEIAKVVYQVCCGEAAAKGEPMLTPAAWQDVVEKLCRPWAERTALPVEAIQWIEHGWAIDLEGRRTGWDSETVFVRGVIDRLDVGAEPYRVVDYKTGYGGTGDPMQADVYAWAMMLLLRVPVDVVFEHTATDYREVYPYNMSDLTRLDTSIRALAEAIHVTADYQPRPGVACAECPYAYCCDAKAEIPQGVDSAESARKMVEAISLLERDLKAAKLSLRDWCEKYGPVIHNGVAWGIWKSEGLGFHDAEKFLACCQENNIDPFPYLSVNNTKAKRLRNHFPQIVTSNPSLSFRGKKATTKEDDE